MTITISTLGIIDEALDRIFGYSNNNCEIYMNASFIEDLTVWNVCLSNAVAQTSEEVEDIIEKLTLANNLCKALNSLEIRYDSSVKDVLDTMNEQGRSAEATELSYAQVDYLETALRQYSDVSVIELVLNTVDSTIRGKTL